MKHWIKKHISSLHKAVCLLLALVLLCSAMITGTLAWTDFYQHKTNSFEAGNIPYSVQLHKYEKDIDGNQTTARVSGAEFYLYKVSDPDDIQIGTRYLTDSDGKIIIDEIEPGDYYFSETNPGYAYEFDEDNGNTINRYDFTIKEGAENINVVVHAFNRRVSGSLTISKEVIVPEGSVTAEGASTEVTPFEEPPAEETTETTDTEPMTEEATDTEPETEVTPTGETGTEETAGTEQQTDETDSGETNPITPFNDKTNSDPLTQDFEFTVTFSDNGTYEYSIDGGTPETLISGGTLKLKHGQTAVFPSLPVGVLYTVTETPVVGYMISSEGHQGNIVEAGNTAKFINTFGTVEPGNTQIQITKVVEGNPPVDDIDKEFEFTLTIDGVPQVFTLKAGETKSFTLPIGAVYEVAEKDYLSDGYSQTIANGYGTATTQTIQVTATNTFIGTEMIEIPIVKTWDFTNLPSGINQSDVLPDSITVHLKDGDRIVETVPVKPDNNGDWKYTFTAPKYRADGVTEIEYTIEEVPVSGFASEVDGFSIKNTYVAPVTFDAPMVEKQIDGDTPEIAEEFHFVLSANDGAPMPEGSSDGNKTVTISGAGHVKFGNITYTNPGTYTYTIAEATGSAKGYGYDSSVYTLTVVVERQGDKLVVKSADYVRNGDSTVYDKALFVNTYEEPDDPVFKETVTISGEKSWNHGTNTNPPKSITLYILADGQRKISFTVDESSHWRYSFALPRYNADGKEIVYTVDEEPIQDYRKSIDGFNITNTHKSVPDPNNPNQGGTGDTNGTGNMPKTGDTSNIWIWIAIMTVSAVMLVIMLKLRPKKKRSK